MPDHPVGKHHDAVRVGCRGRVVSHHDHRLTGVGDGVAQQAQDFGPRDGVEVAGGFIGEGDSRTGHESPRNGNALALATGQLAGSVVQPIGDSHRGDDVVEPRAIGLTPGEIERQPGEVRRPELVLDEYRVYRPRPKRRRWRIFRERDTYRIVGDPSMRALAERAEDDDHARERLVDFLEETGALRALKAAGARNGTTVEAFGIPLELWWGAEVTDDAGELAAEAGLEDE